MDEATTMDNVEALRQAADQARAAADYETAVSLYSQALTQGDLAPEVEHVLRGGRAACYEQLGNIPAQLADLKAANQLLAQQNARLFDEVQERNQTISEALEQQAATSEVLRALSGFQPDLRSLLEIIAINAAKVCGADDAHIYRIEHETLKEWTHRGPIPGLDAGESLPLNRSSVIGRAIVDRETIHIHDAVVELEEADYPVSVSLQRRWGYRTVLSAPLLRDGEPIGGIAIRRKEVRPFTKKQIELLKTFADQAVIAIENVRLFEEIHTRNREISEALERERAMGQILGVIASSPTEIQPVLDVIAENAARLSGSDDAIITYVEAEFLRLMAHYGSVPILEVGERLPLNGATVVGRAVLEHRALQTIHEPGRGDSEYPAGDANAARYGYRMTFSTPLLRHGVAIGAITIRHIEPKLLTDTQIELVKTFADQAVIAIENVRLFQETQRRAREMAALAEVGRDVSATLDLPTVLERIANHARELLGTSDSAVFLPDPGDQTMQAVVALGTIAAQVKGFVVRRGVGIVGDLWQRGQPEVLDSAGNDPRSVQIAGTERQDNQRMMVVPLLSGMRVAGVMAVWRSGGDRFRENDLSFLEGLARQAAIAIENARLYSEAGAARAAAEEANHSKSAFLANVSHELRTPLTSILGFARIVQKRLQERIFPLMPADDDRAQRAASQIGDNLGIILGEGERLTTLINNVLDLEKIDAGRMEWHMEPVSVAEVVTQGLHATAAIIEQAGLRLEQQLPDDLPEVAGDRDKLVQVVINLLSNAIKFTKSGTITCRAALVDAEVQVTVQDTGIGINSDDLPAVFEKFRQVGDTLTDKPKGTGLGLAICKEIVERHGGRIWVESVPGEGSNFTFALPVTGPAART